MAQAKEALVTPTGRKNDYKLDDHDGRKDEFGKAVESREEKDKHQTQPNIRLGQVTLGALIHERSGKTESAGTKNVAT